MIIDNTGIMRLSVIAYDIIYYDFLRADHEGTFDCLYLDSSKAQ